MPDRTRGSPVAVREDTTSSYSISGTPRPGSVISTTCADVDGDRIGADVRVAAGLTNERLAQRGAADEESRLPRQVTGRQTAAW